MGLPQDGSLENGAGHAARSTHALCRSRVGLAEYRQQSCHGFHRCRVRGIKGTEPALLQRFRGGVRARRWRALPLRSGRRTQCNPQARSCSFYPAREHYSITSSATASSAMRISKVCDLSLIRSLRQKRPQNSETGTGDNQFRSPVVSQRSFRIKRLFSVHCPSRAQRLS
jgi:hypothetical protein